MTTQNSTVILTVEFIDKLLAVRYNFFYPNRRNLGEPLTSMENKNRRDIPQKP